MGKDNEFFEIGIKNVNTLEKGLDSLSAGKKIISSFLEQIDDMTAFTRQVSHNNSETLGGFVSAVTNLNNHCNGRKGRTKDTEWQNKTRKSLDYIKNEEGLNTALAYLFEEQHTILKTCQGDLE